MLSKKRKGRKNKDAPADLPVLLISGKDDPVGDMGRGVERLAKYYKGIGGNMVLYLAGLSNVSKECLEAAALDGAGAWKLLIHITLPAMRYTLIYVLMMTTLSSFNVFGQPEILTAGGPDSSTTVAMMQIYNTAFGGSKFGRACAMSLLLALIMVAFTVTSYRLQTKGEKTA